MIQVPQEFDAWLDRRVVTVRERIAAKMAEASGQQARVDGESVVVEGAAEIEYGTMGSDPKPFVFRAIAEGAD